MHEPAGVDCPPRHRAAICALCLRIDCHDADIPALWQSFGRQRSIIGRGDQAAQKARHRDQKKGLPEGRPFLSLDLLVDAPPGDSDWLVVRPWPGDAPSRAGRGRNQTAIRLPGPAQSYLRPCRPCWRYRRIGETAPCRLAVAPGR